MSEYKLAVSEYKLAVSDTYRSFFFKKININCPILLRYAYRSVSISDTYQIQFFTIFEVPGLQINLKHLELNPNIKNLLE